MDTASVDWMGMYSGLSRNVSARFQLDVLYDGGRRHVHDRAIWNECNGGSGRRIYSIYVV